MQRKRRTLGSTGRQTWLDEGLTGCGWVEKQTGAWEGVQGWDAIG